MIDYLIVTAWNSEEIQKAVTLRMNEGWACQGGVSVTYDSNESRFFYSQAMVSYVD